MAKRNNPFMHYVKDIEREAEEHCGEVRNNRASASAPRKASAAKYHQKLISLVQAFELYLENDLLKSAYKHRCFSVCWWLLRV